MPEQLEDLMLGQKPTAERPLLGQTILVIEDSRFASEALRLMSLRSGARVRRADCLKNAARHLATYRPSVLIVDVGLPDGSGTKLISDMAEATSRIPVILGISGDDSLRETAVNAGADGFLSKPIASLAEFQQTILERLPSDARPLGPRTLPNGVVEPDASALRDDLSYAAEMLTDDGSENSIPYLAQFLSGVARSAQDDGLESAANELGRIHADGEEIGDQIGLLAGLVDDRLRQHSSL